MTFRATAWAKVKTDKIDAATLARLHAAQFLPEVWTPPVEVELQRRVIAERTQLVSQMTRLKNRIQSILHANLIPKETGRIFTKRACAMLEALPLPADQMRMALRHHDEQMRLAAELAVIDRDLAQRALADPKVKRLMTIGGVDSIVRPFEWAQNGYSLLSPESEGDLRAICWERRFAFSPYSPLAGGILAGRYRRGEPPPPDSRLTLRPDGQALSPAIHDALDQLQRMAEDLGVAREESRRQLPWVVQRR